jgi:hypothetical protein
MRRLLAAALAALCLAGAAGATIKPGRGMSGVDLGMTARQVEARLGRPLAKGSGKWFYFRVIVAFRNRRVVELTTTNRSMERFANGVTLGSSEADVRRAFPRALCAPWSRYVRCRLGTGARKSRVTDFIIGTDGRLVTVVVSQLP